MSFEKQASKWFKTLNSKIQASFRKIRVCKPKHDDDFSKLVSLRSNLRQKLKTATDEDIEDIEKEIESVEDKLAMLTADENKNKVFENFSKLNNTDGSCNLNGMWKVKKKLFPKHVTSVPVAKKDLEGKIVSSHDDLKKLYSEAFKHRLRHRPIKDDYQELKALKEELCHLVLVFY